ncbi:MAG: hypothetical protein ACTSPV_12120 [Candidatus Hodarchaeales archaeon]
MVSLNIVRLSEYPSKKNLVRLTLISLILLIFTWLLMLIVTIKNNTIFGVLDLEFAWSVQKMDLILQTWGDEIIQGELLGTIVDFGFLICYSTFLAGLTLIITRKFLQEQIQGLGYYLTLTPFVAALFDAIENANLLLVLSSPLSYPEYAPFLASFFASIKFLIIIVVIIFDVIVAIWYKIKG